MLNIIIPSYNDEKGLYQTLFSLNHLNINFQVQIIDDASTENIDYEKIQNIFQEFFPINIKQLSKNIGPGNVRQLSIQESQLNDYIMFIDCGDMLVNPHLLPLIINKLDTTPYVNIIGCGHIEEQENNTIYAQPDHNRMHGKIYRVKFLRENHISFNPQCAYGNEDIGFNQQCKIICSMFGENTIEYIDEPLVVQTYNINSLTRQNDYDLYYSFQIYSSGFNLYYAIENIKKSFFVNEACYVNYICEIFIYMYITYLNILQQKPHHKEKALHDSAIYFNIYKKQLLSYKDILIQYYKKYMAYAYTGNEPFTDNIDIISLQHFIDEIKELDVDARYIS